WTVLGFGGQDTCSDWAALRGQALDSEEQATDTSRGGSAQGLLSGGSEGVASFLFSTLFGFVRARP
ncbi:MAG TPA: hypothetical protein VGM86_17830, partial [Thermoanaerobaculia bacterium]